MKEYIAKKDIQDKLLKMIAPEVMTKEITELIKGLYVSTLMIDTLETVTKADICRDFGDWYFSRIKLPEEEREKFTNEWNDLVRDYIAEKEQG